MTYDKLIYVNMLTNHNPNKIVFLFLQQGKISDKVYGNIGPGVIGKKKH